MYQLGHQKYSFTELTKSITERSYADLSDEKLKKLYNQMKDEQLSPVAGQQFKMIVKAMKAKKIPLNEESTPEQLYEDATANAKKSLDAIVGHLEKRKASGANVLGATGRSMLKMGQGMQASFKGEGGFSPDQAKWIWKTSMALFN